MLNKVSGLARTLYIVIAIAAAFVAMGGMNVALVLVVLGLIAGITLHRDKMVLAAALAIVLPIVGTALAQIPSIGTQLGAVTTNLQLGVAGALATAIAVLLFELAMAGVTGLTGAGGTAKAATA
jgi:hypothetical protein